LLDTKLDIVALPILALVLIDVKHFSPSLQFHIHPRGCRRGGAGANRTNKSLKAIFYFSNSELTKVNRVLE